MDITYETPYVMLIHGVACSIKHNPPKIVKFQNAREKTCFMIYEIW